MRLYRGKRLDNGEWVYGYLLKIDDCCFIEQESQSQHIHSIVKTNRGNVAIEAIPVDPTTVGQQIGLCDKHGKEIYANDKLRLDYKTVHLEGIVKQAESGEWELYEAENSHVGVHHNKDKLEIIGTIHDEVKK